MTAAIKNLLQFCALALAAIAVLIGALLLDGCAGAPRVRIPTPRQESAARVLRRTSASVAIVTSLCPVREVPACEDVRNWGAILTNNLRATANALTTGGTPADTGVCLASAVVSFFHALDGAHAKIPDELILGLDRALDYLPDCPSPPDG